MLGTGFILYLLQIAEESRLILFFRIFILVWAGFVSGCRGREYAEKMPVFRGGISGSVILFSSVFEPPETYKRIHILDPSTGALSETEASMETSLESILAKPVIQVGTVLLSENGQYAYLRENPEEDRNYYGRHRLSPGKKYFLRMGGPGLSVTRISDRKIFQHKDSLSDCGWISEEGILCLQGGYNKEKKIVLPRPDSTESRSVFELNTKGHLGSLRTDPEKKRAAFCETGSDSAVFYKMNTVTYNIENLGSAKGYYCFDLALSSQGIAAAKVVKINHTAGLSDPADIWISEKFGPASGAGILLNLPSLESPGFLSGEGFKGVEGMAFSPDGLRMAVLMSEKDDCRMADEGGNIACRKNIHIVSSESPTLKKLTNMKTTSASGVLWEEFR